MIAELDLLADHPGRAFGRGTPRFLRMASTFVLFALVGGVGVAAIGAARAPTWDLDLQQHPAGATSAPVTDTAGTQTFARLFELLLRLESMPGLRIDSADVRRAGAVGTVDTGGGPVVAAQLRVTLGADQPDILDRLREELSALGLENIDLLDYTMQVDGAVVTLQFEARMTTERLLATRRSHGEPVAELDAIIGAAGADILAVRTPLAGDGVGVIALSATGPRQSLVAALGAIEQKLSSPSRIESVTLRRQDETRSSLDVRFSARPSATVGGP
jgi:hypothetical protein